MTETDETLLDDLFERALAELLRGREPDLEALLAGRPDLRDRAADALALARAVAGGRAGPVPPVREVAGYELVQELGRGSSSAVFLARQRALGERLVALKLLGGGPWSGERARRRFLLEVRALARVRHPHVVPVLDVVEDGEHLGFAMAWVPGKSLGELIARRARGSPVEGDPAALPAGRFVPWVCRLGVQIASALQAVHDAGLLHRDVKPGNVLLDERYEALLADFGLVRDPDASLHTVTGDFVGTLGYASPEQLAGATLDARADVYGLGATLYHALAGEPPVRSRSLPQALAQANAGVPPLRTLRPDLPRDLETVVHKAIAPERERRYATAAELGQDLQRILELQPVRAVPPGRLYRLRRLVQRNRAAVWGTLVGVLLAVLAIGAWWVQHQWRASANVRVTQQAAEARLLLLDARHTLRLRLQAVRGQPAARERTRELVGRAALAYDQALKFQRDRTDLVIERNVLRAAYRRLEGEPLDRETGAALAEHCPATFAWASGGPVPDAAALTKLGAVDARGIGVLAWVDGDLDLATAALQQAEGHDRADPFVQALLGVVFLARGEPQRALPRLLTVAQGRPDHGGLQLAAMRAAVECGDLALAERLHGNVAAAATAPDPQELQLACGDLAWLRGDDAEAERCYQRGNHYHRLVPLWLARADWRRSLIAAVNQVALEPGEPMHRRHLLQAARAYWAEQPPAMQARLLLGATAGEVSDAGHLLGVLAMAARARAMLAEGSATVPMLASQQGARRFAERLEAGARDPFDLLVQRTAVLRLDLARLLAMPAAERQELVAAWLDEAGEARAAAILQRHGALRESPGDPFVLAPDLPLPAPLRLEGELLRPNLDFQVLWRPALAVLPGPTPRLLVAGAGTGAALHHGEVAAFDPAGVPCFTVRGGEPADGLGSGIAGLGDLDGDGFADAALATGWRSTVGRADQVWLVSGQGGRVLRVLEGHDPAEVFGYAMTGLSAAVAVSATHASVGDRVRCGVVRVFEGDGTLRYELAGRASFDAYGQHLATPGDLDGDGALDLAVGTGCAEGGLYVELRSGRDGVLLRRLEFPGYRGSACVAGPGDLDGDGVGDLLVGLHSLRPWTMPAGEVVLVSGRTGEVLRRIAGERPASGFGLDVQGLGDLDGDGRPEFAVAASCEASAMAPAVHVYSGTGERLAVLPSVWRVLRVGDGRLVVLTVAAWTRYGQAPMGSGARVRLARWGG